MTTKTHSFGILFAIVMAFASFTAVADSPAPTKKAARYEVAFFTEMIQHHEMAVMMSEMCLDRAVHPELIDLCGQIRTAQMEEIEMMQSWLSEWYGVTYEPNMKPGDQKMMERLGALSGAEFEIEFMEMMIKHHEKAVRNGAKCVDMAYHTELIEMCENILQAQTEEILRMESWLCEWYQICAE